MSNLEKPVGHSMGVGTLAVFTHLNTLEQFIGWLQNACKESLHLEANRIHTHELFELSKGIRTVFVCSVRPRDVAFTKLWPLLPSKFKTVMGSVRYPNSLCVRKRPRW